MDATGLPRRVRSFIARHIGSALDLEILLAVHEGRNRAWTPSELARDLRTDPAATRAALRKLVEARIVAIDDDGYSYSPRSSELADSVDVLADAHAKRRVRVIEYIYSRPNERVTTFADEVGLPQRD